MKSALRWKNGRAKRAIAIVLTAFKILFLFGLVFTPPAEAPRLREGSQTYCPGLTMTVYNPGQDTAIIFIHGGGWRAGSPSVGQAYADSITSAGYTYATIELTIGSAPQQVQDTICAIEYLRARGINRWGLIGKSSGGHVAAVVTLTYGAHAAALLSAPLDLSINCKNDTAIAYFGLNCKELADSRFNPINLIYSPYQSTFWLGHGASDKIVFPKNSREFAKAFQDIGGRASLNIFAGGHEGLWVDEVTNFFRSMFG